MKPGATVLKAVLPLVFVLLLLVVIWPKITVDGVPAIWVKQKAQLRCVDTATDLFNNEFDFYLPSDANDLAGKPSCGAMRLAEALLGQDLLGYHSKSVFRRDGMDATGTIDLYLDDIERLDSTIRMENLKARKGPYLPAEIAHANRLEDIYGKGNTGLLPEDAYVLCDVFERKRPSGKKTGMPVLYYRASRLGRTHRVGDPNNIYHYSDNHALLALGVPGEPGKTHPLIDPKRFYLNTQDRRNTSSPQPYRPDSYILISAGWDGLYGTADDICNFDWKYREQ